MVQLGAAGFLIGQCSGHWKRGTLTGGLEVLLTLKTQAEIRHVQYRRIYLSDKRIAVGRFVFRDDET